MDVCEEKSSGYERTLEEVEHILSWADLGPDFAPSDLLPEVQCLSFTQDLNTNEDGDIKLLEVDSSMLQILESGKTFTIRGDEEEPSVLCTEDETYEIRTAETSNAMLIVPKLKLCENIDATSSTNRFITPVKIFGGIRDLRYLELKSCSPRIRKLSKLLNERLYYGRNSDKNSLGFLWEEFLHRIQCSENQLTEALKNCKAYEIGEHWYILDIDYHFGILSSILNLIESESYSLDKLDKKRILEVLKVAKVEAEYILDQCFEYFFVATDDVNDEGNALYQIKYVEVSQFFAQILLKTAEKFNLDEFLSIWQNSVPEGVVTDMSHLNGLALVEESNNPKTIFYFPVDKLPNDVAETFNVLFDIKNTWTAEEIQPYLQDFCSNQTPAKYYLTRYARSYMSNEGVKCFTSKHLR